VGDFDPQFLAQLTHERGASRFAALHFSTRELPVAGVDFALGALRQQEMTVGSEDYRGGNLYRLCGR
jgi:hypothetical protein